MLLPVAVLAVLMAVRTTSTLHMMLWFGLMLLSVAAWMWLRYRLLFPARPAGADLTPLDPVELAHLREQAQANREAEAAARRAAEEEALHPIHPVEPVLPRPVAVPVAPAAPEAAPAPPISGRAVFVLPDDVPPVIAPGDRRP